MVSVDGIKPPEESKWVCNIFPKAGGYYTIMVHVNKDTEPSWFHRKMQEILLGVKWEYKEETE